MKDEEAWFYSDAVKLHGRFYYPGPEDPEERDTVIVICSGFLGMNNIHPARFARALTDQGYICFGFDYRGFAKSHGDRRRVLLQEQVRDIENACIYVSLQPQTAGKKLVLIGWGMGAGLVIEAADESPNLAGLVCINGFYNGYRFLRVWRTPEEWRKFMDWLGRERAEEVLTGETKKVDAFLIYPLDGVTRKYVDEVLSEVEGFAEDVELRFAYSLLHFNPEGRLQDIPAVPLLIAHAEHNKLHPLSEAESLYRKYPGDKELYIIPHAGHTEWMCDDCDPFLNLIERLLGWMKSKALT